MTNVKNGLRFGLSMKIKQVDISKVIPYARNPRKNDKAIAKVAASLKEYGWRQPIVVDSEMVIIAGHTRLEAARSLEMAKVPVHVAEGLTPAQVRAYRLADNRVSQEAEWSDELLALELSDLQDEDFDLSLTGFNDSELNELLSAAAGGGNTDDDEVPDAPEDPIAVKGDVWLLGDHRLMCGDSTSITDVETLSQNQKCDMVFTDPPYNVDYEGYTKEKLTIKNDAMSDADFDEFLNSIFANYRIMVKDGASLYVCHASSVQTQFQDSIESAGIDVRCQIIWAKNTFAWGMGRYKFQHEPIFYCHVKGQSDAWYGDKTQSTLWQVKKPAANKLHPTMKPIELIDIALLNSSKSGDLVADLFGGSGSTLIACEKNNRKCITMELDPIYCDVIIKRWQEYTGQDAIHESSKKKYNNLAKRKKSA